MVLVYSLQNYQLWDFYDRMGGICTSQNLSDYYRDYFKDLNVSELKNQWTTLQVYKIRKMFQKAVSKKTAYSSALVLDFDDFCTLFPEFIRYEQEQKRKIFQIFDREAKDQIDWNSFYNSISLCYFAPESMMAVLMFIIFDEQLEKCLTRQQLMLLMDLNAVFMRQTEKQSQMEPEQALSSLLEGKNFITLEQWVSRSIRYFDFNQFRRLFNIFKEQKLEKQLVENFFEWNELYNEEQQKYISYIVSYKWFEGWKTYVESEYNITLSIEEKNPTTLKSIKSLKSGKSVRTKKSDKTNNSNKSMKKILEPTTVKRLKIDGHANSSIGDMRENIKNYDMIHSSIGERPHEIYNYFLEGQFEEVLKPGLVENRDYVLVSEKVWRFLHEIYDGYPEFRRTGYDQIQLYPKVIKIYNDIFKGQISYCTEISREVSGSITIQDLLTKSIQIPKQDLQQYSLYYRTIDLPYWIKITNFSQAFSQLTPLVIIFLIYLPKDSQNESLFEKRYLNSSTSVKMANLGDTLVFQDLFKKKQKQKQVVFMKKNIEGKYIVHFVGEPYTNDRCLSEKDFFKCCKLKQWKNAMLESKPKHEKEKKRTGLPQIKKLSFITSSILHFLENKKFRDALGRLTSNTDELEKTETETASMSIIIGYIGQLLRAHRKVDPKDIHYLVNTFLPGFVDFDITLIHLFLNTFIGRLQEQAEQLQIDNVMEDYEFDLSTSMRCEKCYAEIQQVETNQCVLEVSIPENPHGYYQVNLVPFNLNLTSLSIKKYGFELNKTASLKQYKQKFESLAEMTGRTYVLAEVYGHTIIKNYSQANNDTLLSQLNLREDDCIYAYEICTHFDRFIHDHYFFSEKGSTAVDSKDLKIGEMIDCKSSDKGWIAGKIIDKDIVPYTYKERLKVLHKPNHSQSSQVSYEFSRGVIACYPSHSYMNCDQYHVRLVQRVFNEANNNMETCNIPLVIALTSWARWKQFHYLVFLQVKKFISEGYKFNREDQTEDRYRMLGSGLDINILREASKMKSKRFQEYLYGKCCPYTLNFIDYSGHCAICYKFVKSVVYKGQSEKYCQGCKVNPKEPLIWQIRVTDLMIAVDWVSSEATKSKVVKTHFSYINMMNKKKKDMETIEGCLDNATSHSDQVDMLCCNVSAKVRIEKRILNAPNYLIINLRRVVQERGYKKIVQKAVSFSEGPINIQGNEYQLVGLTTLKGHQSHINYCTYIKSNDKWFVYNGERVQVARSDDIDRRCTLVFYYKKKTIENIKSNFFMQYKGEEEQEIEEQQPLDLFNFGENKLPTSMVEFRHDENNSSEFISERY